ncbi:ectonucleoside triphosphate diphosphohydrolase 8-like [Tachyglossus aculeatus]|uniref:ectonucleoside triphosphate diphosphohydrolase 8-like n=1 Tax=Tachyglossus aculeatus TaxID=9261 RepID=UPI0018F3EA59|nr:ectonucleoside triphosphate diphosphohydrolase 8-like [Tachyglossus aculeatus]
MGTLSFLIFCITAALVLNWCGKINIPRYKYGMVFDAGSSHTKLFLYEWPAEKENGTGLVTEIQSCEVKGPGISSYASEPQKAGNSLRECLDQAMKIIPAARQRQTPVFLGATAGMRLLSMQDKKAADQILDEVAKTIQGYPVDFREAQIISGKDEGGYGWLTTNYLLKSFTKGTPALGALDLGGASTQISFIPLSGNTNPNTTSSYQLYGHNYTIYTHSYLCYGQDQARKQVIQRLVEENLQGEVQHPCYPKNFKKPVNLSEELVSPCTNQTWVSQLGPAKRDLKGTGNFDKCRNVVERIFKFDCQTKSCAFNEIYQPPLTGKFFAFSAYYYTFNFLNLTAEPDLHKVENAIRMFCYRSWDDLTKNYPGEKKERLQNYCGNAIYILTLLLKGYKFNKDNWNSIQFKQHAGDSEIGWTLGYMLDLTNSIPKGEEEFTHRFKPWVASNFFISLVLLVALVLLVTVICKKGEEGFGFS